MKSYNPSEIAQKLAQLREEHKELDLAIDSLSDDLWKDQLSLQRLKKRKLKIKDWIEQLESQLIPDLDA